MAFDGPLPVVVERQPEDGLVILSTSEIGIQCVRDNEALNPEPKIGVVDVRGLRVLEDRLESDWGRGAWTYCPSRSHGDCELG